MTCVLCQAQIVFCLKGHHQLTSAMTYFEGFVRNPPILGSAVCLSLWAQTSKCCTIQLPEAAQADGSPGNPLLTGIHL